MKVIYLEYKTQPNQMTKLTIPWASMVCESFRNCGLQSNRENIAETKNCLVTHFTTQFA